MMIMNHTSFSQGIVNIRSRDEMANVSNLSGFSNFCIIFGEEDLDNATEGKGFTKNKKSFINVMTLYRQIGNLFHAQISTFSIAGIKISYLCPTHSYLNFWYQDLLLNSYLCPT